jgi:hypothetical protein
VGSLPTLLQTLKYTVMSKFNAKLIVVNPSEEVLVANFANEYEANICAALLQSQKSIDSINYYLEFKNKHKQTVRRMADLTLLNHLKINR